MKKGISREGKVEPSIYPLGNMGNVKEPEGCGSPENEYEAKTEWSVGMSTRMLLPCTHRFLVKD
jgi:hypothetical protein